MNSEKSLWVAVVRSAVVDASYRGEGVVGRRERRREDAWIRGGGADFSMVCSMAGLDPSAVHKAYVEGIVDIARLSVNWQGQA